MSSPRPEDRGSRGKHSLEALPEVKAAVVSNYKKVVEENRETLNSLLNLELDVMLSHDTDQVLETCKLVPSLLNI